MRKLGAGFMLAASAMIVTGGPDSPGAATTRPPKNLKRVGDHWTPWDPPQPGPDAYVIQKGDTLWDLAQRWFNDPFLWPQIWDENRYILDSHWIYPGDPLIVPGKPTVVPEEGPPPVAEAGERAGEGEPAQPVEPPRPVLLPAADASDLYCAGFITRDGAPADLRIIGRDLERIRVAEGDVVFINGGRAHGLQAGDEFTILRRTRDVIHPVTDQPLGTLVRRLGRLRVLLAHEDSATALIEMSCEDIVEGDELMPWEEIPVPLLDSMPPFARYDPTPSGGPQGHIVSVRDDLTAFATGNVIYTDLGAALVRPGDVLTLYRERNAPLPRMNLGQAVILTVNGETSTAKIMTAVRESAIGDRVEVVAR
jgi:hypothetical protein